MNHSELNTIKHFWALSSFTHGHISSDFMKLYSDHLRSGQIWWVSRLLLWSSDARFRIFLIPISISILDFIKKPDVMIGFCQTTVDHYSVRACILRLPWDMVWARTCFWCREINVSITPELCIQLYNTWFQFRFWFQQNSSRNLLIPLRFWFQSKISWFRFQFWFWADLSQDEDSTFHKEFL